MTDATHLPATPTADRFPWWVLVGAALLAACYLPTLNAPFDFVDDGNLVYPTRGLDAAGHVQLWWQRVVANVEHLGPFRPVLWAHWQVLANLFGANAVLWRAARLVWCGASAGMLLWLMREVRVHPVAAVLAAAAAMWNPYRNDIWTSLTLAEGVAMPYALLALVAARKACTSPRAWAWDVAAVGGLLFALGCKNVFVALLPAMAVLRVWREGNSFKENWRANGPRALLYGLPVLVPLTHYAYFRVHWKPGQYETPGPSLGQAERYLQWLKGAVGTDFLAAGVALVVALLLWQWWRTRVIVKPSQTLLVGTLLLVCGFLVYLPVSIMCGRYTMPAVWGFDLLLAGLLTRFVELPQSWMKKVCWVALGAGLIGLAIAGVNRQEKLTARSRMLWNALEHVEQTLPEGAAVEWVSGDSEVGELNAEEGIHFYWHLLHRGRGDIRVGLVDILGRPVPRTELAPLDRPAAYRIGHQPGDPLVWKTDRDFNVKYRYGWRQYRCTLEASRRPAGQFELDPDTARWLKQQFEQPPVSVDPHPAVSRRGNQ